MVWCYHFAMRLLLGVAVFSGAVFAQDFRAVISGEVSDATGASIPGVRVVAQNLGPARGLLGGNRTTPGGT
jgi:hypothetical protein